MGLRINTNVQSTVAQHRLSNSREALQHTQEKMASGSRIIQAMDDAAGLAISENMRSTMRATGQNIKNAHDGFYLLQTADGALNEVTNIVVRMKELSTQAASDTNGDKERGYLDNEYQQLKQELDRISETTLFNGRPLLNGQGGEVQIQVGPDNRDGLDRITVAANFEVNLASLGLDSLSVDSAENARDALDPVGLALDKIAAVRGAIGAGESRLNSALGSLAHYEENTQAAYAQIRDADFAYESSQLTKQNILSQAGLSVLAQANASPQMALKLLGS